MTKKSVIFYVLSLVFMFCSVGFLVYALTDSKLFSFKTNISYSFEINYALEVGYDKDDSGSIEESEYFKIYENYNPSGNIEDLDLPNIRFLGNNSIQVYDENLAVGDKVDIRITNYNQASNFDPAVYTKGPALRVTSTSNGASLVLENIKPYNSETGLTTNGIIHLQVATAGELIFKLNLEAHNYYDFDLKYIIASPYDGKITMSQVESTETTIQIAGETFLASCPDSLLSLSASVNGNKVVSSAGGYDNSDGVANNFDGATISMTSNIDFTSAGDLEGYANNNYYAIGNDNSTMFKGDVNGNSKKITGLKINRSETNLSEMYGVFGAMDGNLSGLTLESSTINAVGWVGGIVGRFGFEGSTNTITNCTVASSNTITASNHSVGGVVGLMIDGNASALVNQGASVTGESRVGGVMGYWNRHTTGTTVSNLTNSGGSVTANNTFDYAEAGGVIGGIEVNTTDIPTVSGLTNTNGAVSSTGTNSQSVAYTTRVGGVVGWSQANISNATNSGAVSGYNGVGGVVGMLESATLTTSSNTGNVTGFKAVGGIVGHLEYGKITGTSTNLITSSGTISGNFTDNTGSTKSYLVGGIVGELIGKSGSVASVSYVKNNGTVSGAYQQGGGIAGGAEWADISNATNAGQVTITYRVGGIVGWGDELTLTSCTNNAQVQGTLIDSSVQVYVGGIIGSLSGTDKASSVTSCTNTAKVMAPMPSTSVNDKDSYADSMAGGIAGFANSATISNCTNSSTASVIGYSNIGGIVGSNHATVTGCTNNGVVGGIINIGGIIGRNTMTGKVVSPTNTYSMSKTFNGSTYDTNNVGGFIGYLDEGATVSGINNTIAHAGGVCVGGIVGFLVNEATLASCTNTGAISATYYAGGIAGYVQDAFVNSCSNGANGTISATEGAGGIAGKFMQTLSTKSAKMISCSNAGKVQGAFSIGGVAGYTGGTLSKCSNSGNVRVYLPSGVSASAIGHAGGITGYSHYVDRENISPGYQQQSLTSHFAQIYDCYNTGNITIEDSSSLEVDYVGGIVGYKYLGPLSGCYNTGTIGSTSNVNSWNIGGLFGYAEGACANIYNTGAVYGTYWVGGIVGQSQYAIIANARNTGTIKSSSQGAGGICGYSIGITVSNSYNNGAITSSGPVAGGIVGYTATHAVVKNSYNFNTITSTLGAGGIVGYVNNLQVTSCVNQGTVTCTGEAGGGIVGYVTTGGSFTATSCTNFGAVSAASQGAGGIVGEMALGTVTSCHNKGAVTGPVVIGGVVGFLIGGNVRTCNNIGNVTGTSQQIGGIAGRVSGGTLGGSSSYVCNNYGTVKVNATSGIPFIGGCVGLATGGTISYIYNKGTIAANGTGASGAHTLTYTSTGVSISYHYHASKTSSITAYACLIFDQSAGSLSVGSATGTTSVGTVPTYTAYTSATLLTALNNYRNSNTTITEQASDLYGGSGKSVTLNTWVSASPWPTVNIVAVSVSSTAPEKEDIFFDNIINEMNKTIVVEKENEQVYINQDALTYKRTEIDENVYESSIDLDNIIFQI